MEQWPNIRHFKYERGDIVRIKKCDERPELIGKLCQVYVYTKRNGKKGHIIRGEGEWYPYKDILFPFCDLEFVRPQRFTSVYKHTDGKGGVYYNEIDNDLVLSKGEYI